MADEHCFGAKMIDYSRIVQLLNKKYYPNKYYGLIKGAVPGWWQAYFYDPLDDVINLCSFCRSVAHKNELCIIEQKEKNKNEAIKEVWLLLSPDEQSEFMAEVLGQHD